MSERRTLENPQALESYLRAADPPRWMQRCKEIDVGVARVRADLAAAYAALRAEVPEPAAFAARWRALVRAWRFDPDLNELIAQHNEWYPVERQLPLDIRTRDYRLVNGRSYRRLRIDAAWALAEFPPEP